MTELPPVDSAVQQGLIHAGILFLVSYTFASLVVLAFGDITGSQSGMLAHLASQQILVVGGLSALWISASGIGSLGAFGWTPSSGAWLVTALLLAGALALLQAPVIASWAGVLQLEAPDWYGVALTLDSTGMASAVFLAVALVPAVCEELFFRGYLLARFRTLPVAAAIGLQAALFALYHLDLYGLPVYLFSGVLLGLVRVVSGALWPAIVLHMVNNIIGILDIDRGESLYSSLSPWGVWLGLAMAVLGALVFWRIARFEHPGDCRCLRCSARQEGVDQPQ